MVWFCSGSVPLPIGHLAQVLASHLPRLTPIFTDTPRHHTRCAFSTCHHRTPSHTITHTTLTQSHTFHALISFYQKHSHHKQFLQLRKNTIHALISRNHKHSHHKQFLQSATTPHTLSYLAHSLFIQFSTYSQGYSLTNHLNYYHFQFLQSAVLIPSLNTRVLPC